MTNAEKKEKLSEICFEYGVDYKYTGGPPQPQSSAPSTQVPPSNTHEQEDEKDDDSGSEGDKDLMNRLNELRN